MIHDSSIIIKKEKNAAIVFRNLFFSRIKFSHKSVQMK